MASIVIVGAGIAGLAAALALSDRGHEVRLLDREPAVPALPPQQLADAWSRRSVPQADRPAGAAALGDWPADPTDPAGRDARRDVRAHRQRGGGASDYQLHAGRRRGRHRAVPADPRPAALSRHAYVARG